jgi:hypothetical protein
MSPLIDASQQLNFRLRALLFVRLSSPPRLQILIQIVALFSSGLSRYSDDSKNWKMRVCDEAGLC